MSYKVFFSEKNHSYVVKSMVGWEYLYMMLQPEDPEMPESMSKLHLYVSFLVEGSKQRKLYYTLFSFFFILLYL